MILLVLLVLPVLFFVVLATRWRASQSRAVDATKRSISIHKQRLSELTTQFESGDISEAEYRSLRLEEEKALLVDADAPTGDAVTPSTLNWGWVVGLAVIILSGAYVTYTKVGAGQAVKVTQQFSQLAAMTEFDPTLVNDTLDNYQDLLSDHPEDIEGWFRLARMQLDLEKYEAAIVSLDQVLGELRKSDHDAEDESIVLTYIGQANLALNNLELALVAFEDALTYSQSNTALGLAGRISFEMGDFQKAIDYWTRLKLANPNSQTQVIDEFIDNAIAQLKAQGIDYEAAPSNHLVVNVELPLAWEGLASDAILFVYARPVGLKMPVAAKRLRITAQTVQVVLTDADGMGNGLTLSSVDTVEVTARVSLTGIANTQPGDWSAQAVTVDVSASDSAEPIQLKVVQP